jgi:SprT-like family
VPVDKEFLMIVITHPMLIAAYDMLEETKPFSGWNLPASDHIKFSVVRMIRHWGDCCQEGPDFRIRIADRLPRLSDLITTMAHEMVHLHMFEKGIEDKDNYHGPGFQKLARQACRHHGFAVESF